MVNNRVILIDNGNIQFRSIFAYRNNPSIPVTWTYLNMVTGYLRKLEVTLEDTIVMAQDYGSWRKDIDKTYKAQRQDFRESFEEKEWWQKRYDEFNDLYEKMNKSLPFSFIKKYKCEADDVISVACRYYKDKEIIIVSSDKDLEMLLSFPNVKIFSPISKRFKKVPNPTKVLLDKIQGDISDNLLDKPSSEAEFERRKKIVDLINPLPEFVEQPIKEELDKIMPKNLYVHKIPFRSIQEKFKVIYKLNEE
jgi:5'-3' exonuclease